MAANCARRHNTTVPVLERLTAAGFTPRYKSGEEKPPVTSYVHKDHAGAPVEFLLPEIPSRKPAPATREIGGISAQTLKGLDLLLIEPWTVTLAAPAFRLAAALEVRVPNPVAFVLHKLLVSSARRDRAKRDKDVLCAYETVLLFADADLREVTSAVRRNLSRGAVRRLRTRAKDFGRSPPPDAAVGASVIVQASGRIAPPAEQIAGTIAAALRRFLD